MIRCATSLLLLFLVISISCVQSRTLIDSPSKVTEFIHGSNNSDEPAGTKWAVLIAGSNGYGNYRHQADVCHAYQILKKGGLKDENIVVFMYDDIAFSEYNPRPGVLINKPNGNDVYAGVPKDYTGADVNVQNFFAVLLGNRNDLTGGSGKVVDSSPNDHIFVYYTDHGGPGVLGMPSDGDLLYANDLNDVLKKKHASGTYKSLVFYIEACESGSIFEGLLPKGLNIYATTAANAEESSYGFYCPDLYPSPASEYDTCLGDMYSISWLEDSDLHDLRTETLKQQYQLVKRRTLNEISLPGSHVMQYGDIELSRENLFTYMGTNPENDHYTSAEVTSLSSFSRRANQSDAVNSLLPSFSRTVNQRHADIVHLWHKFQKAPEGSPKKLEAQKQYLDAMDHRKFIDRRMQLIGQHLFGSEKSQEMMNSIRPAGRPLVDDWSCLKTMVKTFETHCGNLSRYGMKYTRSLANICNAGVQTEKMAEASARACASG